MTEKHATGSLKCNTIGRSITHLPILRELGGVNDYHDPIPTERTFTEPPILDVTCRISPKDLADYFREDLLEE